VVDDPTVEDLVMVLAFCTEYLALIFFTNWPPVKPWTSLSLAISLFFLKKSVGFLSSSPLTVFVLAHAVCLDSSLPLIDTSLGISLPATCFVTFICASFGLLTTISGCFMLLISLSVFLSEEIKGLELKLLSGNVVPFATSLFGITVEEMVLGASLVEVPSQLSWSAEDLTAVSLSLHLEDE
jgi:hypothetical protein